MRLQWRSWRVMVEPAEENALGLYPKKLRTDQWNPFGRKARTRSKGVFQRQASTISIVEAKMTGESLWEVSSAASAN